MAAIRPSRSIQAGRNKICQNYPNRCPTRLESCSILWSYICAGRGSPEAQKMENLPQGRTEYNKPVGAVKNNFRPGIDPLDAYLSALSRVERRDLYREAVFSCRTPFLVALSSVETVSR